MQVTSTTIPVPRRSRAPLVAFLVSVVLAVGSMAYTVVQLSESGADATTTRPASDAGASVVAARGYAGEPLAVRFPRPPVPSGDPLLVRFGRVTPLPPTESLVVRFARGYEPVERQTEPLVVRFGG